ncbi:hypothetical protein IAE24_29880, partial [Delftia sp. S65]|uniref:hypothetical protein n=1 Tax=Delftia sp. S65 TaxID=2767436 RepID=UPI0019074A80
GGGRPPRGAAGGSAARARRPRHKSGIAVRFPRMLRWREDKPVQEADSIDTLAALLPHSDP